MSLNTSFKNRILFLRNERFFGEMTHKILICHLNLIIKEAPPEVFDNRTLYEKLKEQHDIKKTEFESKYALSKENVLT